MPEKIDSIIKVKELSELLGKPGLVLVDARSGPSARERYEQGHIAGALYVDLDKQLADIKPDAAIGGRHPLPSPAGFSNLLEELGIGPDTHVVVYDDKNGANAAARFWWMLRASGYEKVQVLDGGLDGALRAGFILTDRTETPVKRASHRVTEWQLPIAVISEVAGAAAEANSIVIDVREKFRYDGIKEPIDLVAGHIPGAVNIPYTSNLDAEGNFLSPGELHKKYTEAIHGFAPEKVIVHCGSGVTACHTLLAMDHAGLPIPRLYVGSWSEWSRNSQPVAIINGEGREEIKK